MMLAPCMNSFFQARLTFGGDVADRALHDAVYTKERFTAGYAQSHVQGQEALAGAEGSIEQVHGFGLDMPFNLPFQRGTMPGP